MCREDKLWGCVIIGANVLLVHLLSSINFCNYAELRNLIKKLALL